MLSDDSVQEKLETARLPSILMFDHPRHGMCKRDLGKLAFHGTTLHTKLGLGAHASYSVRHAAGKAQR